MEECREVKCSLKRRVGGKMAEWMEGGERAEKRGKRDRVPFSMDVLLC